MEDDQDAGPVAGPGGGCSECGADIVGGYEHADDCIHADYNAMYEEG